MHRTIICVVTCHMVFGVVSQAKNSEMPDPGGKGSPLRFWQISLPFLDYRGQIMPTIYSPPYIFRSSDNPGIHLLHTMRLRKLQCKIIAFTFFYAPTKVSFVFLNELSKKNYLKERQVLNCRNSFEFFLPRIHQACFLGCRSF